MPAAIADRDRQQVEHQHQLFTATLSRIMRPQQALLGNPTFVGESAGAMRRRQPLQLTGSVEASPSGWCGGGW